MTRSSARQWALVPLSVAAFGALGIIAVAPPAAAEPLPYGPDTCIQGFVWREARSGDTVWVTPDVRSLTAAQNGAAAQNKEPNGARTDRTPASRVSSGGMPSAVTRCAWCPPSGTKLLRTMPRRHRAGRPASLSPHRRHLRHRHRHPRRNRVRQCRGTRGSVA